MGCRGPPATSAGRKAAGAADSSDDSDDFAPKTPRLNRRRRAPDAGPSDAPDAQPAAAVDAEAVARVSELVSLLDRADAALQESSASERLDSAPEIAEQRALCERAAIPGQQSQVARAPADPEAARPSDEQQMTGGSPAPARAQPAAAAAAAAERAAPAARSTAFSSAFSSADLRDLFSLQDDCKSDTYEKVMRAKRDEAEKAAAALNAEQDSPENPFGLDEDEGEGEAAAATCEHQLQNGNPSEIDLPDWAHHPDLHLKKHEGSEESSLEDAALRASRAEDISFVFTNVTAGVEFGRRTFRSCLRTSPLAWSSKSPARRTLRWRLRSWRTRPTGAAAVSRRRESRARAAAPAAASALRRTRSRWQASRSCCSGAACAAPRPTHPLTCRVLSRRV